MQKTYKNKLDNLEKDYQKQQKQFDEELESVFFENKQFRRELEGLSENYRYHYQQADFEEPINMNKVYHMLERCQEEGNQLVNQATRKLEDSKEESSQTYKKESKKMEDEWLLLKEKEGNETNE